MKTESDPIEIPAVPIRRSSRPYLEEEKAWVEGKIYSGCDLFHCWIVSSEGVNKICTYEQFVLLFDVIH